MMKNHVTSFMFLVLFFNLVMVNPAICQKKVTTGVIKGKVIDADTKAPLIGTNVVLVGTVKGVATGMDGSFVIRKVPVGSYVLQFDYIGYEQLKKADVIVRPERITFVNVELRMSAIETDEISVTAGYFIHLRLTKYLYLVLICNRFFRRSLT